MKNLHPALRLLTSVLCLCAAAALAQNNDITTTPLPPPEPAKPAAEVINPALPTLWVASDSTAANGGPNATGWGVPLPDYFDLAKIQRHQPRPGRA